MGTLVQTMCDARSQSYAHFTLSLLLVEDVVAYRRIRYELKGGRYP